MRPETLREFGNDSMVYNPINIIKAFSNFTCKLKFIQAIKAISKQNIIAFRGEKKTKRCKTYQDFVLEMWKWHQEHCGLLWWLGESHPPLDLHGLLLLSSIPSLKKEKNGTIISYFFCTEYNILNYKFEQHETLVLELFLMLSAT